MSNGSFLTPDALEGIYEFCLEATVFFDVKVGYLGAYLNEGLTRYVALARGGTELAPFV